MPGHSARNTILGFLSIVAILTLLFVWLFSGVRAAGPKPDINDANVLREGWSGKKAVDVQNVAIRRLDQPVPRVEQATVLKQDAQVKLVVTGPSGKAVKGAAVAVLNGDSVEQVNQTDSEGVCSVSSPSGFSMRVVYVTSDGYGDLQRYLALEAGSEHRLSLAREATIEGSVVTSTPGAPLPRGLRAYAWSSGDPPARERLSALQRGVRSVLTAEVESSGRFTLRRVNTEASYTVCVGGSGWTSPDWKTNVVAGARLEPITACRVFGCVVTATTAEGMTFPPVPGAATTVRCLSAAARDISFARARLAFAEVQSSGNEVWRNRPIFFACPNAAASALEVEISYVVPGVKRTVRNFHIEPVRKELDRRTISLERSCSGFGRIRLIFTGGPAGSLLAKAGGAVQAHLVLLGEENAHVKFPLFRIGGSCVVDGIPHGTYTAHLSMASGSHLRPLGGDRVIVGDATVDLRWSLSGSAALLIQPRLHNPCDLGRAVRIQVQDSTGKRRARFIFDGPPYLLTGLGPRSYQVTLWPVVRERWGRVQRVRELVHLVPDAVTELGFSWTN